MGFTTIIKTVMVLVWLCVAEAQQQFGRVPEIVFPDNPDFPRQSGLIQAINRQTTIGNKPRCTNRNGDDDNAPCENDEDYNQSVEERFRHLLVRFTGNQVVRTQFFQNLTKPEIISGPDPNDESRDPLNALFDFDQLCASEETIIFPKRAKTRSNDWVFVLNQGKRKQAVKVEKCRNNNHPCNLGAATTEVNSVCRQKYIYKKLLVMNSAGNDIVPESVLMPSCCVCYIKKERNNFGGGFGDFNFRTNLRSGNINNGGNNFGSINGQRHSPNQVSNRRLSSGFGQG